MKTNSRAETKKWNDISSDGPNRKLEMAGESVNEHEDSSAEIIQHEKQRGKKKEKKKKTQSSIDLWEKKSSICVTEAQ